MAPRKRTIEPAIPSVIRVAAFDYRLQIVDEEDFGGDNLWGECNCAARLIRLSKRAVGIELYDTCVHEILHALYNATALKHGADDSHEYEERVVLTLASGLTQVFRDNPKLVAWLNTLL